MKLDELYNDAKSLRFVVNTLLDFIAIHDLNDEATEFVKSELDMSNIDAADLVEAGIQ